MNDREKQTETGAKGKLKKFIDEKNVTKKKVIKITTITMVIALIVFSTVSNAVIDPKNLEWSKWLTNSLIMIAIMVFGLLMGESIGEDELKDRKTGLYQTSIREYEEVYKSIECIKIYFSHFFLWYKEREIRQAKIDFLMDNEVDGRWAKVIVDKLEKNDFVVGKFILDETNQKEKIYVKELENGELVKIHKATKEEADKIIKVFDVKINTYGYAYYLSYTDDDIKGGNLNKAIPLNKKVTSNKLINRLLKIAFTLFISLIWGMMTTQEFTNDKERTQAWFLLLSRIACLMTSFVSGWVSAIITVKTQSQIIRNKKDVLQDFKDSIDKKLFTPETYDDMVEREYTEQLTFLEQSRSETESETLETP